MSAAHSFDPQTDTSPDIVIIGSGMGGATFAAGLADSGLRVVMLERGDFLKHAPDNRMARTVYMEKRFHPDHTWLDKNGREFQAGNYYNVGGNSKFYGSVMFRYRAHDFDGQPFDDGPTPAWPIRYDDLAPWYQQAEQLYQVRGDASGDPLSPAGPYGYTHPPVPDEPSIIKLRARLKRAGLSPFSLPLAVDHQAWLAGGGGPWDGYPDTTLQGKKEAESCGLARAAENPGFKLITRAMVRDLQAGPDGRITAVRFSQDGQDHTIAARLVVLSTGAINSAALLLKSGLANRSDQVGRNFMNHNASVLLGVSPGFRNTARYQKTLSINDFYSRDNVHRKPLGNVQLLGRIVPDALRGNVKYCPNAVLKWISDHAADFYVQSEDIPKPENRVTLNGDQIVLSWHRSNLKAHLTLVRLMRKSLRRAGFPVAFHRLLDEATPSHQCGTVRMGDDAATAPLRPDLQAWDHPNLMVVDASSFVTSAAVNPALTVAALSLRAAKHAQSILPKL